MRKTILLSLLIICMAVFPSCAKKDENLGVSGLSDKQIEEIALPLIEKSLEVYDKLMGLSFTKEDEAIVENDHGYFKTFEFNSKEELWDYAETVYTQDAAKRIFSQNITGDDKYFPKFVEKNGSLYVTQSFYVDKSGWYNVKSIEVLKNNSNKFTILVNFHYTHSLVTFVNTSSGWRLDGTVVEGEKEYVSSTKAEEMEKIFNISNDGKLTLLADSLKKSNALSESEAKEIFVPLFKRSITEYQNIYNSPSFSLAENTPDFKIDNASYYFVEYPELKSLDDIWDNVYLAYTEECANRIFFERLDSKNEWARYLEKEGKLYYQNAAHGYATTYDFESLKLVEQYENALIFEIDEYVYDEFYRTMKFVLQKTAFGWRMANAFDEEL